ncbi:protein phosphatase 1 regulatory [Lynx pardinus]|uniref:Protein phosphatase 1 regulatory n=1 Tax=Lynx pardinus TaxID=191816 RepID=A0A485MBS5_LYNPA|nr:protein phosphatase 1 regulatory [Lynx pardinus]
MGSHLSEDCGRGPGPRGPRDQRQGEYATARGSSSEDAGRSGERRQGSAAALRAGSARAGGAMSRERPPRTDIPRNLSFIAALTERAYYRSQRPSLEEEPEVEPGEGGTRLGARSRAHAPSRAGGRFIKEHPSPSPTLGWFSLIPFGATLPAGLHSDCWTPGSASDWSSEARAALEPASEPGFAARLQAQRICLERAEAGPLGVAGSARVLDLAYEKRVSVRWSADGWRSQREAPASYAGPAPPPPRADRFAFRLPAPPIGGALLFALRYRVTGHEFWDNNGGRDYALRGPEHPGSGGAPEPQGWIHFI